MDLHPWTILETGFVDGSALLRAHAIHCASGSSTSVLHYVALCTPYDVAAWSARLASTPQVDPTEACTTDLSQVLHSIVATALPGFQRFLMDGGKLSLTLCIGSLADQLAAHNFEADEVMLHAVQSGTDVIGWDKWAIQSLARRCRRGTAVRPKWTGDLGPECLESLRTMMLTAGFQWPASPTQSTGRSDFIEYNPHWQSRTTRTVRVNASASGASGRRCAVVGGGLAGASVARALALRGHQVSVVDQAPQPGAGASGLPMGVLVPHVSVDDSPRSRLSRVGVMLMLQHATRALQEGVDYQTNGVLQMTENAEALLKQNPTLLHQGWLMPGEHRPSTGPEPFRIGRPSSVWHPKAGWMRPKSMVRAWLQHPSISWHGGVMVHDLEREAGVWKLRDTKGQILLEAEIVILANAGGAAPVLHNLRGNDAADPDLLAKITALQGLHGTLSYGSYSPDSGPSDSDTVLPGHAVNGSGSWVSILDEEQIRHWFAGASYDSGPPNPPDCSHQHAANFAQLSGLLPDIAASLSSTFAAGKLNAWSGVRCVTHDRLPLVGPVDADGRSGLWLNIGLGSRGLSLSAVCAELLVARIGNEPLPIESRLARSLDAHRPRRMATPKLPSATS